MIRPTDPNLPDVDQLEGDVSSYVRMRMDDMKLSLVESLSTVFGKGMALILAIVVCSVALTAFSVALLLVVSVWVNSYIWGAVILGGFYLIVALVVWLLRGKFVDKMVGVFARMVFSTSKDDEYGAAN